MGLAQTVYSKLVVQGDSRGAVAAIDRVKRATNEFAKGIGQFAAGATLSQAVATVARGVSDVVSDIVERGSQVERLTLALNNVGQRAGYTTEQILNVRDAVTSLDVSTQTASQAMLRFIQAGVDLSQAEQLVAAAKDLSVASNIKLEESIERLALGIQRQSRLRLDDFGIQVLVGKANDNYIKQLQAVAAGQEDSNNILAQYTDAQEAAARATAITVENMSVQEKQQAFVNEVLLQADNFAGTYAETLETVGTISDIVEQRQQKLREVIGEVINPGLLAWVKAKRNGWEALIKVTEDNRENLRALTGVIGDGLTKALVFVLTPLLNFAMGIIEGAANLGELVRALQQSSGFITVFQTGMLALASTVGLMVGRRLFILLAGQITTAVVAMRTIGVTALAQRAALLALSGAGTLLAGAFLGSIGLIGAAVVQFRNEVEAVSDVALEGIGGAVANIERQSTQLAGATKQAVDGVGEVLDGASDNTFTWGQEVIIQFAGGMASAISAVVSVLTQLGRAIAFWLQPQSPPRILPDIDKWGKGAADVYMQGWLQADFDVFNTLSDRIESALRGAVSVEGISEEDVVPLTFAARDAIARGLEGFNATGQIDTSIIDEIGAIFENTSPEIEKYVQISIEAAQAAGMLEEAQASLQIATASYEAQLSSLESQLAKINNQDGDLDADRQRARLQEIIASDAFNAFEREKARVALARLGIQDQIRDVEGRRDAEISALEAQEAKAEKALAIEEERIKFLENLLGVQEDNVSLYAEQLSLLEKLASESAGVGEKLAKGISGGLGEIGETIEDQLGNIDFSPTPLPDLETAISGPIDAVKEELINAFLPIRGEITELGRVWNNVFVRATAIFRSGPLLAIREFGADVRENLQEGAASFGSFFRSLDFDGLFRSAIPSSFNILSSLFSGDLAEVYTVLGNETPNLAGAVRAFVGSSVEAFDESFNTNLSGFIDRIQGVLSALTGDSEVFDFERFGQILTGLGETADKVREALSDLFGGVSFSDVRDTVFEIGAVLAGGALAGISSLADGLLTVVEVLSNIRDGVIDFVLELAGAEEIDINGLVERLGELPEKALEVALSFKDGFDQAKQSVQPVIDSLISIGERADEIAVQIGQNLITPIKEAFGNLFQDLSSDELRESFDSIKESLGNFFESVEPVAEVVGQIITGLAGLGVTLAGGAIAGAITLLTETFSALVITATDILAISANVLEFFGNLSEAIANLVQGDFSGFTESLTDAFGNLEEISGAAFQAGKDLAGNLISGLGEALSATGSTSFNILEGLLDGTDFGSITDRVTGFKDSFTGLFSGDSGLGSLDISTILPSEGIVAELATSFVTALRNGIVEPVKSLFSDTEIDFSPVKDAFSEFTNFLGDGQLAKGFETIKETFQSGTLSGPLKEDLEGLIGLFTGVTETVTGLGSFTGEEFELLKESVVSVWEALKPFLDRITEVSAALGAGLAAGAIAGFGAVLENIGVVIASVINVFTAFGVVLRTVFETLAAFLTGDFTGFVEGLRSIGTALFELGQAITEALVVQIQAAFTVLIAAGSGFVTGFISTFLELREGVVGSFTEAFNGARATFSGFTDNVIQGVQQFFRNTVTFFASGLSTVRSESTSQLSVTGDRFSEFFENTKDKVVEFFENLVEQFSDRLQDVRIEANIQLIKIRQRFEDWRDKAQTVVSNAINTIKGYITGVGDIREDLTTALNSLADIFTSVFSSLFSPTSALQQLIDKIFGLPALVTSVVATINGIIGGAEVEVGGGGGGSNGSGGGDTGGGSGGFQPDFERSVSLSLNKEPIPMGNFGADVVSGLAPLLEGIQINTAQLLTPQYNLGSYLAENLSIPVTPVSFDGASVGFPVSPNIPISPVAATQPSNFGGFGDNRTVIINGLNVGDNKELIDIIFEINEQLGNV